VEAVVAGAVENILGQPVGGAWGWGVCVLDT
jgi:hypothetical protein